MQAKISRRFLFENIFTIYIIFTTRYSMHLVQCIRIILVAALFPSNVFSAARLYMRRDKILRIFSFA